MTPRRSPQHPPADERGLTMVLVAVVMTAMMAMVALVLDGGQAYSTRRRMQNAADAGAVAATRSLDRARFSGGLLADVDATARSVVAANGGDTSGLFSCDVIDKSGAVVKPCSDIGLLSGWASPSNILRSLGVRVNTGNTRNTAFGRVVNMNTLTVRAEASASIQPLIAGDSPFMTCAFGQTSSLGLPLPDLLVPDVLGNPLSLINTAATGQTYRLHDSGVATCGAGGSSFKGLVGGAFTLGPAIASPPFPPPPGLPGYIGTTTGVRSTSQVSLIADRNACTATKLTDCNLVVPICTAGAGTGSDTYLYCVAFGTFYITAVSSTKHTGVLLPGAIAIGGQTSSGDPNAGVVRAIKLVS